jgi:hypothetical protein
MPATVPVQAGERQRTYQYVKDFTGLNYEDRWLFLLFVFLFAIVYRLLAMLAIRYVSYLKR